MRGMAEPAELPAYQERSALMNPRGFVGLSEVLRRNCSRTAWASAGLRESRAEASEPQRRHKQQETA